MTEEVRRMKQKLNLAILNKRKGEVTKKEMSALRAGISKCSEHCDAECSDGILSEAMFENLVYSQNCQRDNIWVIIGLSWF